MSINAELSHIFGEMASILEILGASPFRVNAHRRVSRVLKDMTSDVASLADDIKQLTAIDGIGDGTAKKIIEYVKSGAVSEHGKLLEEIPEGLLRVLAIPGLGPKTVKLMWEKADVTDPASLKAAIDSGVLENLPRMGAKTIQNIRESMAFAAKSQDRIRLGEALPIAEVIMDRLREVDPRAEISHAGSLRRGKETIGDIDILIGTRHAREISAAFRALPGVAKVQAAGETKASIRLESGLQVDLRMVDAAAFGAALMYFTGSKEHNVVLRERAIKRGLRLNEYGLFHDDGEHDEPPQKRGVKPVAAKTEQDIYLALELPWLPPEIREQRGELDLTETPKLIELADIRAELHAHTIASDGKMTIDELAGEAKSRGFHTIAITDHSKSSAQANGLSPDRLRRHIEAVREADSRNKGISILAGSEVDILADGHLDYQDDLLAKLDFVVASPHVALKQDAKKATSRLLAAIRHPLVHVLGHPTGRLINSREGLLPDVNALVEAAVESDTALEINANYHRLDLRDTHVRAAVDAGALIAINTDAHSPDHFDLLRYGILTARRGWLTSEGCINTWTAKRLHGWIKSKRS